MKRDPKFHLAALVMLLVAAPVVAQKIYIDYDHEYDFEGVQSYAFVEPQDDTLAKQSPMMAERLTTAIKTILAGELKEVPFEEADIAFTYASTTRQNQTYNTSSMGYGRGPGWGGGWSRRGYGGGWASSTTTVSTYESGTLIIDAFDVETKTAIWRGSASSVIPSNPKKEAKKIDKSIRKMAEKWHSLMKKR